MSIYLKLELVSEDEIADWKIVKAYLRNKSNTETLRTLIRQKSIEARKSQE